MRNPTAQLSISNDTDRPRTIIVEPLGSEFVIGPGSALQIVTDDGDLVPSFGIIESDDMTSVYLGGDFEVFQGGGRIFPL